MEPQPMLSYTFVPLDEYCKLPYISPTLTQFKTRMGKVFQNQL